MYKVLVSEKPLNQIQQEKLTNMGAVVPYDPSFSGINVYIYCEASNQGLIEDIKDFIRVFDYRLEITEEEVQKHIQKIKIVNEIHVGDVVQYPEGFRATPFKVLSVEDEVAKIQWLLRGGSLTVDVPTKFLKVAEEYFPYDFPKPIELEDKLIVDMDSIVYGGDNYGHFLSALFPFLVRLKLRFPKRSLIIANPDTSATYFCQLAGIMVAYGDLGTLSRKYKSSIIYTHDMRLARYVSRIVMLRKERLVDYNIFEILATYHCNLGGLHNFYNKALQRGKTKYTDLLENNGVKITEDSEVRVYSNINNLDIEKLREFIIAIGIPSFASNLEKYLRIFHI